MKKTKTYKLKSLVSGSRIGLLADKFYAPIPDRGYKDYIVIVEHKGVKMTVKDWHKAQAFKRFHDQFRKGEYYTLGYFEFVPDTL